MTTYHVKRNGKLYGPFNLNNVAKCINTDIFTAKDEISDDQISWQTIEKFQSEQKIVRTQPVQTAPVASSKPFLESSNAPFANQYAAFADGKGKYIRHYRLIACFLGGLGIHDFWTGYTMHGVIKLILTLFGLGLISKIWSIVNIFIVTTDAKDIPLLKGGCHRVVYILLCIFLGLAGTHHLYAGFLVKWLIQLAVTVIFSVVFFAASIFGYALGGEGVMIGIILFSKLFLLYYILTIILGCRQKIDADGYEFV